MEDCGWQSDGDTAAPPNYSRRYTNKTQNESHGNGDGDRWSSRLQNESHDNREQDRWGNRSQNNRNSYNTGGEKQRYQNRNGSNPGRFSNDSSASITIEIDPSKVGMVIGKGGGKIREIQEAANVNVKVDRDPGENGLSCVTIRGDKDGMAKAKKIIEDLVGDEQYSSFKAVVHTAPQPEKEFEVIDWGNVAKKCEEAIKAKWAQCPQLVKNFYIEDPAIAKLLPEDVAAFREANNSIQVSRAFPDQPLAEVPIPNPVFQFEHCFNEWPDLLAEIKNQGFNKPSPIQCQAWPVLLKGEDMIGIAQTGTGKTLAFLLPAMIHTEYQPLPRGGPNVLVMAPTRELAIQIEKEVSKYKFRNMKAVCVYGGGDRRAQIANIKLGVEIIIATPGRLNDLIDNNVIDVASITYLVLDEADRMLDMGFEPQIRKFLLNVRPDRQTVMTSATWPPGVRRLAERYMINPVQVCIGSLDLAAVHSVEQVIEIIDEEWKYYRIMDFIKNMQKNEKAIIFCGKKARADDLSSEICLSGVPVQCIHGDRDQIDREQALADIKSGEVNILIATDVASRGIDIEDISHVVNYDFPRNIEEYVHRVGRTGRAGRTGVSLSFFTREDWGSAAELIGILEEAHQEVPDELREMKRRFEAMKERKEREKSMFGGRGGDGGRGYGGGGGGRYNRH